MQHIWGMWIDNSAHPNCGLKIWSLGNTGVSYLVYRIINTLLIPRYVTAISVHILKWLHLCQLPQSYCHTWDWIPSRFSLWVVQNWSSTVGPGWSPWSRTVPESFFRTFHICPDHWTIRVSIEYNKPLSSGQPAGLRETEWGNQYGYTGFKRLKYSGETTDRTKILVYEGVSPSQSPCKSFC